MRLLLTGASGFIGSEFYKRYRTEFEIKCISFRQEIEQINTDNIDAVIHLSALVHQMNGAEKQAYHEVNVSKTVALAKKAKASGVKQFVFMSSIKVYGEERDEPYDEKSPCQPTDPYGQSKLDAEKALMPLRDDGFKIVIIRTPVVYGEGVKANILKLIELTDRYRILPFGNIHNRRSMIYVGNLTHLITEVIRQKEAGIFLAADDYPISTSELISEISKSLGKRSLLFNGFLFGRILKSFKPDVYRRLYGNLYLDSSHSRSRLHLKNPYTTQEGIKRMVAWYKEQH